MHFIYVTETDRKSVSVSEIEYSRLNASRTRKQNVVLLKAERQV